MVIIDSFVKSMVPIVQKWEVSSLAMNTMYRCHSSIIIVDLNVLVLIAVHLTCVQLNYLKN